MCTRHITTIIKYYTSTDMINHENFVSIRKINNTSFKIKQSLKMKAT